MAGVLMIVLGLLGVGGRILRWLPMPVAMGMLAGSILGDVSHVVSATMEDVTVAGMTVTGYAFGRLIGHQRLPPVAMAMAAGGVAVWRSVCSSRWPHAGGAATPRPSVSVYRGTRRPGDSAVAPERA